MTRERKSGSVLNSPHRRPTVSSTLSTFGPDYNTLSNNAYTRMTTGIYLLKPMVVKSILIDIYAAGTYGCSFITTLTGSTDLYVVNSSFSPPGNTEYEIVPTNGDFYMPSGAYYLSLTGNYRRWYLGSSPWTSDYMVVHQEAWDGVVYADCMPLKLKGYLVVDVSTIGNFIP